MNKEKILILPEVYEEVHTWWPFAVVKKMYDLDSKTFDYIKSKGVIEREASNYFIYKILWNLLKISFIKYFHRIYKIKKIKKKLNSININKYDKIISHDPIYSYLLIQKWLWSKLTNIYHWQWSLFNEHKDLLQVKGTLLLKNFLENIEYSIYKNVSKIWFPSLWAYDALLNTTTNNKIIKLLNNRYKEVFIFYNWINKTPKIKHNKDLEKHLLKEWYNFVTISSLNNAKWVDRIPQFLWELKKKWIKFSWTLVWKGELSNKIKQEIKENNIYNESNIFEQWFPKEDILGLLSKTDFYILFHRFSIFDLATLEAMNYWNTPILSNIWWNKEVIIKNNWLLINENNFNNIDSFKKFINNNNLKKLKTLNKWIIENNFSEENFIKKYQEF